MNESLRTLLVAVIEDHEIVTKKLSHICVDSRASPVAPATYQGSFDYREFNKHHLGKYIARSLAPLAQNPFITSILAAFFRRNYQNH